MWQLTRNSSLPIYLQIVDLIETKIMNGELLPEEKLPPERQLAELFGVNRSTVVRALDELTARAVIIRKQGSGTTVNAEKWGLFAGQSTNWRHYLTQGGFTPAVPYIRQAGVMERVDAERVIDAATGELPLEMTPKMETPSLSWQSFIAEEQLEDEAGYRPLRETIQKQMKAAYGLESRPEQILITSGAQQALFLITQCLLKPGDAVAIESPSYFYSLSLFQSAGLRIFALPMDEDGVIISELRDLYHKHRVKMVFVNPTFQNPTGLVMGTKRRKELVKICAHLQIPIVEDDPFSELAALDSRIPAPLKQLDTDNVLYIGSLSKIMGSTTRIGWLIGPTAVIERLALARQEMDFGLSIFPQVLANSVLNTAGYSSHLKQLHDVLEQRRDNLIEALDEIVPDELTFIKPQGGFHLWVKLPIEFRAIRDFDIFLANDLLVMPGFLFGVKETVIRMTYARLEKEDARRVAAIIKQILLEKKCEEA
ncbi:PLP-dependent aminotransferase family protein [Listeria cossartiae subsp. cayugensis]|uniref:aminotransferase-like domain-containing protein n=1 Tax=Listeria cossartiae TaxID=2838249 RepID=UPI0028808CDD|nr:PLP-dependent aminotransferase family protein [Listeria cossartiae]MDT0003605.1 PLP-dependent aminotransferase family protein [Listeria cossartiae subsp. cayugensis]MDT0019999.1 PLP-dependent aminotransferase family protein [Listeria cossartiae subsp. cayugensis]MDT0036879.1 PLP-dependent aminotransferase family protein [Listeria cossartiae subsp. cayugensis]MDT0041750.1 PLP-dependent aminotransferase family protein [Listeria cossartiae subsp. cayugensis]MDT0047101.1 PLP-dependent aminotran